MTQAIQMINADTFYLESRGNKMTLRRKTDTLGQHWEMYTDNASHRAYRGAGVKLFSNLAEVEKSYKSWRGVSQLIN